MGLKYKNSNGKWVPVPIPSEINDTKAGSATTYSSNKIEEIVSNKIDKSEVGNGLKFADGILQLDIPVATDSTTYGGDA